MNEYKIYVFFNIFNNSGILKYDNKYYYLNKTSYLALKFIDRFRNQYIKNSNTTVEKILNFLKNINVDLGDAKIIFKEFNEKIPLKRVQLEITKKCNLRCKHCYIAEYKDRLDEEIVYNLIDEAVSLGVMDFDLTGGEPLTYKGIDKIINVILEKGMDTTIFTNAVNIPTKVKKILEKNNKVKFRISLDGWDSNTHDYIRGKGDFYRTI